MTLSNPEVIHLLNTEFVPCWETVRPVPKVTIDFGDGRIPKRTLTGNTLISVLTPDGRTVDAYPGIYTPADLLKEARATLAFLKKEGRSLREGGPAPAEVLAWHKAQAAQAVRAEQIRITTSKAIVESPLLAALGVGAVLTRGRPGVNGVDLQAFGTPEPAPRDPVANPKAALALVSARIEDVSKHPATVEQLRAQYAKLPPDKQPTPEQLGQAMVRLDSQTNVRLVRPAVHLLFSTWDHLPGDRESRDAVYKQVLHVSIDDPYLGLTAALVPGSPAGSE